MAKAKKLKQTDAEQVADYIAALQHPYKAEVNVLRELFNGIPGVSERIKWNAPSYYYDTQDIVTFNLRATEHVHLVFHHPYIEEIASPLLEGNYKGRRMAYFKSMEEVNTAQAELRRIMDAHIAHINAAA